MAADTYSNTLGFLIMGTGNDNNTWGSNANTAVFQILEDAIANTLTSTVTGGTLDLSGSPPPAAASQARYACLLFNGTLTSNQIVQVPNLSKLWWVKNATAGAFTLTIKTPAGTASTAIPQNSAWQLVSCDGANVITVSPFNNSQIAMPDGSASAPAYSNINERTSGWYRAGTQDWRLSIAGTDVLQATGSGAGSPNIVNVIGGNQLQQNGVQVGFNWITAGGSADAITATYNPALTALTDGLLCFFRAGAANATTTPTFSPNGLTAHTITKKGGSALVAGDIPGNLAEVILRYNLANTRWELLNPPPLVVGSNLKQTGTTVSNPAYPPTASFKNLVVKVASNTTVTITADYVVVSDGSSFQTVVPNGTINLGTTGANALDTGTIATNTWYALYVIAKTDGTTALVASTSFTAPTLPSGYTQYARVGAVQTINASATLYGTWQLGRRAQYIQGLAQTTAGFPIMDSGAIRGSGTQTSPTLASLTVVGNGKWVPTTASVIHIAMTSAWKGGGPENSFIAPSPSWGGANNGPNGSNGWVWPILPRHANDAYSAVNVSFLLEGTAIGTWIDGLNTAIACMGWDDNI